MAITTAPLTGTCDQRPDARRALWHCEARPPTPARPARDAAKVMTIGQLAKRTGVTVKALRRYEGMGLVYTLGRSSTGYRLFDETALACVQAIQSLRGLGLTEAEIAHLAGIHEYHPGQPIGPQLARTLHAARARLTARINALAEVRKRIDDFTTRHAAMLDDHTEPLPDVNLCPAGLDLTPGGRP